MLPSRSLRLLLSAALLLTLQLATAQGSWQQLYTGPLPLSCKKAFRQPDGGFLLVGEESLSGAGAGRRLYLLRTDARGRQQWEQRLTPPGGSDFKLLTACQNQQGELLLGLARGTYEVSVNYLLQLTPHGPIRWGRDMSTGGLVEIVADDAHQGFVVARNALPGLGAELLFLNPDGSQRLRVPIGPGAPTAFTTVSAMIAQPGGVLVATNSNSLTSPSTNRSPRLVFISDMGVRGAESQLLNAQDVTVRLLDLYDNGFLTYGQQYNRLVLGNSLPTWTQQLNTNNGYLVPMAWAANTVGDVLISGFASNDSHTVFPYLALISAANGQLRTLPDGQPALRRLEGRFLAGVAGQTPPVVSIFPGDTPDTHYIVGNTAEGIFLSTGTFAELDPNASAQLQAAPNPVADHELLQVNSPFATANPLYIYDLSGHLLRSWPAVAGGLAQLSLRGLRPGLYLLVGTNGQGKTSRVRLLKH